MNRTSTRASGTSGLVRSLSTGAGFGLTGGFGRIYGLALLLLVLLFVMLTFRGRAPRALERVFEQPAVVDDAMLAARREQVAQLFGGAFVDAADIDGFRETPGYRRLIQVLSDHTPPASEAAAAPPLFDREAALHTPDLLRGQQFKVRGYIGKHWAQKLDQPVFQVTDVWRAVVADQDAEGGIIVDVVDRPPALREQRDEVEFVGYFYRLVRYETAANRVVEVPYLLARSLSIVPDAPPAGPAVADPATLVVLVAMAGMVVWGMVRVLRTHRSRPVVRWRAPYLHSTSVHQDQKS